MESKKQIRRLAFIFIILLVVIVFTAWFDQSKENIDVGFPLARIAMDINGWKGEDLPTAAQEKKWFDDGDLITRQYSKEDNKLFLVAIQERGDRHRVHSPVDCYSGSGWVIKGKEDVRVNSENRFKKVRKMYVVKKDAPRLVYYWFSNGDEESPSFKGHLMLFLKDVMFMGSVKSWVCFQVSADIKNSKEETEKMLEGFIKKIDDGGLY